MAKEITIEGVPVLVEPDLYEELCETLKKVDLHVEEMEVFVTKNLDNQRFYNPQEFLKDADLYFNMSPRNLVQTASKLWFGCVYTVKEYFLNMGIYAVSHRSLKYLSTFAIVNSSSCMMAVRLRDGWFFAEQFHQFSYGSTNFNPSKFESRKAEVEFFILNFPSIDKCAVQKEVMKLVTNSNDEIKFKSEPGKTNIGKKSYDFNYKVF